MFCFPRTAHFILYNQAINVPKLKTPYFVVHLLYMYFCFAFSGHHRAQHTATTAWVSPGGLYQETLTCPHFINLQTQVLPQGPILMPEMFLLKLWIGIFLKILQMFVFQTKSDKNVGFSHLDQCTPKFIAKKVIKLLPALCEHLESSSGFFQVG